MDTLYKALETIKSICDDWNAIKEAHSSRGGWLFDYKLYDLSQKCDDAYEFKTITSSIFEEWGHVAQQGSGYTPEKWDYNKYFEHDNHNGSYFKFRENNGEGDSIDFWANDIGLEWDTTEEDGWFITPFEKALKGCCELTRFSTDRLTPDEYDDEEIAGIAEDLISRIIPNLLETLSERKAVIAIYDDIKMRQCEYI